VKNPKVMWGVAIFAYKGPRQYKWMGDVGEWIHNRLTKDKKKAITNAKEWSDDYWEYRAAKFTKGRKAVFKERT
jgi:hypothetical protein